METMQIIEKNLGKSKKDIQKSLLKDSLIIFFTRVIEDLAGGKKDFYGRLRELFIVLDPYSENYPEDVAGKIVNTDFDFEGGLVLEDDEEEMLLNFFKIIGPGLVSKNVIESNRLAKMFLKKLSKKYLPESSQLVDDFLLGKLISFFGGIKNLHKKPASTIQIIGAEKSLFRHMESGSAGPKYGLIYRAVSGNEKGKGARQLANKLAISIKVDYFRNFAR